MNKKKGSGLNWFDEMVLYHTRWVEVAMYVVLLLIFIGSVYGLTRLEVTLDTQCKAQYGPNWTYIRVYRGIGKCIENVKDVL